MRKRLRNGGIVDVEGILEIDAVKLIAIVGDRTTAAKLREMASRLLAGAAPPAPPQTAAPTGGSVGGLGKSTVGGVPRTGGVIDRPPRPPRIEPPVPKGDAKKTPKHKKK